MRTYLVFYPRASAVLLALMLLLGGAHRAQAQHLVSWGDNGSGEISNMPTTGIYIAVAAGGNHSVALRSDGSLVSWGDNGSGEISNTPTTGTYIAVAAGDSHCVALRSDGSLVSWGDNGSSQVSNTPTTGIYIAVAAGANYSLALRSDGSLVSWGDNGSGEVSNTPTTGTYIAVAAGANHCLALRSDGSLVSWGNNDDGEVSGTPTTGTYIAVDAGYKYSLALRSDGSLVAWGNNDHGQVSSTPTTGTYIAVAAGNHFAVAIRSDHSLVAWGNNGEGEVSNRPTTGTYIAVAAGELHAVAIANQLPVAQADVMGVTPDAQGVYQVTVPHDGNPATGTASIILDGSASFDPDGDPLTYQWINAAFGSSSVGTSSIGTTVQVPLALTPGIYLYYLYVSDPYGAMAGPFAIGINVNPEPNRAPTANSQALSLNLNFPTVLTLTGSDPDGDNITFTVTTSPAHGTLSGVAPNLIYTPTTGFMGTDSFTFTVTDTYSAVSNTATIGLTVLPQPPIAYDISYSTNTNKVLELGLPASSIESDTLTYTIVSGPSHGKLTGTGDTRTYKPTNGFNGTDTFTFKVNDGFADSNVATVTIVVSPLNHDPKAAKDTATTTQGTAVTINVLANDTDSDGDTLTVQSITQPSGGTAVLNADGTVTYTPAATFKGKDTFQYTISDGRGGTDTATVAVTVTK